MGGTTSLLANTILRGLRRNKDVIEITMIIGLTSLFLIVIGHDSYIFHKQIMDHLAIRGNSAGEMLANDNSDSKTFDRLFAEDNRHIDDMNYLDTQYWLGEPNWFK